MPATNPFFLYGALRSGTTLLRLMLNQHSGVHSLEETDFLFDYTHADPSGPGGILHDRDSIRNDVFFRLYGIPMPEGQGTELTRALVTAITEKVSGSAPCLDIHRSVSLAARQFPDAKFIHLTRDPRDVARSSVGMGWCGHSYYGVSHWIETERDWDAAALPPQRYLTVRFEELIFDLEVGLQEICAFLDIPFEPGMLNYHEYATYDPPDPSIAQKWKKRASQREIALIEGRVGPLMEARGYEFSGTPAIPKFPEAIRLSAVNKIKRWQYNIRRYGLALFVSHHIARIFGLRALEKKLASRQECIRIQNFQ